MSANVLLHIILASECLVADGAMHALLAGVLFAMAGGVTRRRERSKASMARGIRARILVLSSASPSVPRLRFGFLRVQRNLGRRAGDRGPV